MAMVPNSEDRLIGRVGDILELRGKDLANKLKTTSNRGQEGIGCMLGCSLNVNPLDIAGREA